MIGTLIGISILGLLLLYFSFNSSPKVEIIPWNEETGKSKHIQSKTHDMSLYIEKKKRQTIHTAAKLNVKKIKESRTQFGSQTGALEFMMTICPPFCEQICCKDTIYDGGSSSSNECCILDGNVSKICPGDTLYDGGLATSEPCCILDGNVSKICPGDTLYDGGLATSEPCCILDGNVSKICPGDTRYDGGSSTSNQDCILDGNGQDIEDGGNA
jgi:hypothetical protein